MVGIPGVDVPDLTPQFVDDAADWTGNAAKDSADFVAGGVAGLGGFVAKTVEGGWDLIEDEFEEIKAEAERGLAWLKDQAAEIADYATNPVGDSAALRTSAGAWAAVAEALGRERDSLEGGKRGLAGAWKGPNGDSYLDGVTAASDAMGDVAEQALKVQKLLENGADTIDELNKQVQLLVVEILATITLGAVIGLITGGLGLAAGGARVALVVRKVKALVDTARKALLALRVAQVVRLSAIGYKLRKTVELARAGNKALRGAEKAVKASKVRVAAGKSMLGSSKFGPGARKFGRGARKFGRGARKAGSVSKRGARKAGSLSKAASKTRVGRAVNPIETKKKRIIFGSSTASSAITTSLAKDPKDWTAEDIARIVAGGYLSATAGDKLAALLKGGKGKLGEVGAATVSSAIFGTTASAGTQAAFNEGRVDWTRAAVTGVASGVGGGIGRVPVRSRLASLDRRLAPINNRLAPLNNRRLTPAQRVQKERLELQKEGLELQKERLKAAGRLGPEAIGEGLIRNQGNEPAARATDLRDRIQDLRASDAAAGKVPKIVVPKTPGLDLPKAPVLHTIRPGESLSSIAGDRLDDPDVWRRIREANPGLTDPDLIHPGDRVAIPRDLTFRVAG